MNCSCGGENENCIYCGGLGEYSAKKGTTIRRAKAKKDAPDTLPLVGKLGSLREKAKAQGRLAARVALPLENCPICGFQGTRDQLYKHKRDSHLARPEVRIQTPLERMRCPFCEAPLLRVDYEVHLDKIHNAAWDVLERLRTTDLDGLFNLPKMQRVRCPLCDSSPPAQDVYLHLELQHRITERSLRGLIYSGTKADSYGKGLTRGKRKGSTNQAMPNTGVVELTSEDTSEAHRQMGFVIREYGRYGSHPLHDRHDDESTP
jgi:hypothetical protein